MRGAIVVTRDVFSCQQTVAKELQLQTKVAAELDRHQVRSASMAGQRLACACACLLSSSATFRTALVSVEGVLSVSSWSISPAAVEVIFYQETIKVD